MEFILCMFGFHSLEYKVMIFTVRFSPSSVVASHILHIQEVGRKGRKWSGILLFVLGHCNMINSPWEERTYCTNWICSTVGSCSSCPNYQETQCNKSWNSFLFALKKEDSACLLASQHNNQFRQSGTLMTWQTEHRGNLERPPLLPLT